MNIRLNKFAWKQLQDFEPGYMDWDITPGQIRFENVSQVSNGSPDQPGIISSDEAARTYTDEYGVLRVEGRQFGYGGGVYTGGGNMAVKVTFGDGSSVSKDLPGSITDTESQSRIRTIKLDLPSGKQIDKIQIVSGAYGNVKTIGEIRSIQLIKTGTSSEEKKDSSKTGEDKRRKRSLIGLVATLSLGGLALWLR